MSKAVHKREAICKIVDDRAQAGLNRSKRDTKINAARTRAERDFTAAREFLAPEVFAAYALHLRFLARQALKADKPKTPKEIAGAHFKTGEAA
jgi:hypothetical protein